MADCPNCELDYTTTPIRIVYCPLHASAGKLREALEAIRDCGMLASCETCRNIARAVLAESKVE